MRPPSGRPWESSRRTGADPISPRPSGSASSKGRRETPTRWPSWPRSSGTTATWRRRWPWWRRDGGRRSGRASSPSRPGSCARRTATSPEPSTSTSPPCGPRRGTASVPPSSATNARFDACRSSWAGRRSGPSSRSASRRLRPGVKADEEVLASLFPLATVTPPEPGLPWDADDWIDAMDMPNDPIGRAERKAKRDAMRGGDQRGRPGSVTFSSHGPRP